MITMRRFIFKVFAAIQKQLPYGLLTRILIVLVHIAQITTIIVSDVAESKTYLKQNWTIYMKIFKSGLGYQQPSVYVFAVSCFMSVSFLTLYAYFWFIKDREAVINQKQTKLITIYSYSLVFADLLSFSLVYQISQVLFGNNQVSFFQKIVTLIACSLILAIALPVASFYKFTGPFVYLIPLLAGRIDVIFFLLILILENTNMLIKKRGKVRRAVAMVLIWISLWGSIRYLQANRFSQEQKLSRTESFVQWLYLALGTICSIGINVFTHLFDQNIDNDEVYEIIQKVMKQNTDLHDDEAYAIQNVLIRKPESGQKFVNPENQFGIVDFGLIDDLLRKFISKLQWDKRGQKSADSVTLYFLCKLHLVEFQTRHQFELSEGTFKIIVQLKQSLVRNEQKFSFWDGFRLYKFENTVNQKFIMRYAPEFNNLKSYDYIDKVLEIQGQTKRIYRLLSENIRSLIDFWRILGRERVREDKLSTLMQDIKYNNAQIDDILVNFTRLEYSASKEKNVYQYFKYQFNRTEGKVEFKFKDEKSFQQRLKSLGQAKRASNRRISGASDEYQQQMQDFNDQNNISTLQYIILKEQRMYIISFEMLKNLKYSQDEIFGVHQKKIFHSSFLPTLTSIKQNILYFSYQRLKTYNIPFIDSQNFLVLRKGKVALIPRLRQGFMPFFYLQALEKDKKTNQSFEGFLVDLQTSIIRAMTSNFYELVKLSRTSSHDSMSTLTAKISTGNLLIQKNEFPASQFFRLYDVDIQNLFKNLTQKQTLKIGLSPHTVNPIMPNQLNLSWVRESHKLPTLEKYMIVRVISQRNSQNNIVPKALQNQITNAKEALTPQQDLMLQLLKPSLMPEKNIFAKETFFCPIPNPYSTKIEEKEETINQTNKITYCHYFGMLVVLILVTYIAQGLTYYNFAIDMTTSVEQRILDIKISSATLMELLGGYYHAYLLYHVMLLKKSEKPVKSVFAPNFNSSSIIEFHQLGIHQKVQQFQKMFIRMTVNSQQSQRSGDQFVLQFKNFNATLKLGQSGLLDYAVQLKKAQSGQDIQSLLFLTKNYHTLIQIEKFFRVQQESLEWIDIGEDSWRQQVMKSLKNPITIMIVIVFGVHLLTMGLILYLFYSLESSIKKVASIFIHIHQTQIKKRVSRLQMVEEDIYAMYAILGDNPQSTNNPEDQVDVIFSSTYFQDIAPDVSQIEEDPYIPKQLVLNLRWNLSSRMLPYTIVLAALILNLGLQQSDTLNHSGELRNILIYHQQIYIAQQYFFEELLQVYQPKIQTYLGIDESMRTTYAARRPDLRILHTEFIANLPQTFNQYSQKKDQYMGSNLCNRNYSYALNDPLIVNCSQLPIQEAGFGKSVEFYQGCLQKFKLQSTMSSFSMEDQNYSNFILSVTYLYYIEATLFELETMYSQFEAKYIQDTRQKAFVQLIQISVSLGVSLLVFLFSIYTVSHRSKIVVDYFCIVPRELIKKMQVTSYLVKNQILTLLDYF